MIIDDYNR